MAETGVKRMAEVVYELERKPITPPAPFYSMEGLPIPTKESIQAWEAEAEAGHEHATGTMA